MLVTTITLAIATALGRPYLKMIATDFGKQIGSIPLLIYAFMLGTLATLITIITPHHESRESLYQTVNLFKVFFNRVTFIDCCILQISRVVVGVCISFGCHEFLVSKYFDEIGIWNWNEEFIEIDNWYWSSKGLQWQSFRILYGGCTGKYLLLYC